jgi:hypothetical protein
MPMRRQPRLRQDDTNRLGQRRPGIGVPDVPTFQQDTKPAAKPTMPPDEDPSEEAVRRMVEAAYT